MKNKYLIPILLILLIIPSIWFLAKSGFVVTDDGNWMIIRFSAFYQALRDGQFPVRFLPRLNFSYGYPVANFLYPGFMYIGVPFKLAGLSFEQTIKAIIGASFIGGGLFIYLWLRNMYDEISSFFGALIYTYAPYHLFDAYKRGSIGEVLSLAVMPFVLWQLERRNIFWIALGVAMLIISHNTLAILFLPLILLYIFGKVYKVKKNKKLIEDYILSIVLGLTLSAFFWLPAVFELGNTVFAKTKISDYSQYFADIYLIGIPLIVILILSLLLFFIKKQRVDKNLIPIIMFVVVAISIFFASSYSELLWAYLPVSFVQFPFRALSLEVVGVAFLTAFVLNYIANPYKIIVGTILLGSLVYFSMNTLLYPKLVINDDSFYSTNEATTTVMDEYMPVWVKNKPSNHPNEKVKIVKGQGDIQNIIVDSNSIQFNYLSKSPSIVEINTIYYPGWKAFSNKQEKAIFYDNSKGLMDLKLEGGNQTIKLVFGETPIRLLADAISLITLLLLIAMEIKNLDLKRQ
ncbi:MAG TPA: 6-pyruvoyl-tetrahydropterin synthase-related protein [Patescibacteria group bacterium]|nr:6-pyruvoyl-tetrahydropterin synthase-related protein [Patescibacteria group bacterium]